MLSLFSQICHPHVITTTTTGSAGGSNSVIFELRLINIPTTLSSSVKDFLQCVFSYLLLPALFMGVKAGRERGPKKTFAQ